MIGKDRLRALARAAHSFGFSLLLVWLASSPGALAEVPVPSKSGLATTDWQRRALSDFDWPVEHLEPAGSRLFVAGQFSRTPGESVDGLAVWDGTRWTSVGNFAGRSGQIQGMAWDSLRNLLYVVGDFLSVNGVPVAGVARWDGVAWSGLQSPNPPPRTPGGYGLRDVAVDPASGHVYVGGSFNVFEGITANGVARWDGARWHPLGVGIDGYGYVDTLLWSPGNTTLYVAGTFDRIDGGIRAEGIAAWNGSTWQGIESSNFELRIGDMAFDSARNRLYVSGSHNEVGNNDRSVSVVQWDGAQWSLTGDGRPSDRDWTAAGSLALDGTGTLYAVASFQTAHQVLLRFAGGVWTPMFGNDDNNPYAIAWDAASSRLVVGGQFREVAGVLATNVAAFGAVGWTGFAPGTNDDVLEIIRDPTTGDLYAGGEFTSIDGVPANRVARWDGSRWIALGAGIGESAGDRVTALAWDSAGRRLFAGGNFAIAGGSGASNIAVWDGTRWSPLGAGLRADNSMEVNDLAWDAARSRLVATGRFDDAGSEGVRNVAIWTSGAWSRLGSGLDQRGFAIAIRPSDGGVYVGGDFFVAGGANANGVALWTAGAWQGLNGSPPGVRSLDWDDATSSLLAGRVYGVPARLNAATGAWEDVGAGLVGVSNAVAPLPGGRVLVAGSVATDMNSRGAPVALWDGCGWREVGSGAGSEVSRAAWVANDRTLLAVGRLFDRQRRPMAVGALVLPTNIEPQLRLTSSLPRFADEDALPVPIAPDVVVCDPEGAAPTAVDVAIADPVAGRERLVAGAPDAATGDIVGSFDPATATLRLSSPSGSATLAQWQEAMRRVGYSSTNERQGLWERTIGFTVVDRSVRSETLGVVINLRPINDPPVAIAPASFSVVEDTTQSLVGFDFSDPDEGSWAQMAFEVDRGRLQTVPVAGAPFQPSGWGVSMSIAGSPNDLRAAIAGGALRFTPDLNDTRPVTLTYYVLDTGISPSSQSSPRLQRTITIVPADDPPVIVANVNEFPSYREGDAPTRFSTFVMVTDDEGPLRECAARIASGGDTTTDVLGGTGPSPRWNAQELRLDFAAPITAADCTLALRSLTFRADGDNPRTQSRRIEYIASDAVGTASAGGPSVSVWGEDDAPTLLPAMQILPGQEDQELTIPGFDVADPDSDGLRIMIRADSGSWRLLGPVVGIDVSFFGRDVMLRGRAADIRLAVASPLLAYVPARDANGDIGVAIEATGENPGFAAARATRTLRLAPAPDAPRFAETPGISGAPRPGNVLRLPAIAVSDPDGDRVSLRYQWLRDDQAIAGATEATYTVLLTDVGRRIRVRITASDGVLEESVTTSSVLVADPGAIVLRGDRVEIAENTLAVDIAVLVNDAIPSLVAQSGRLSLVSLPANGTASVKIGGVPGISDDVVQVVPRRDWSGSDRLRYQVCDAGTPAQCAEAELSIVVAPAMDGRSVVSMTVPTASGFRDIPVTGMRALTGTLFSSSPLRQPVQTNASTDPDPTPESPWDRGGEGTSMVLSTIQAEAAGRAHVVIASAVGFSGDMDLYVGVDVDGNGLPSASELRCTAAMSANSERCIVEVQGVEGQPLRYWKLLHNRAEVRQTLAVLRAEIPLVASDGSLVVTSPGQTAPGQTFPVRVQWNDPTFVNGERRWGVLRVREGAEAGGIIPVFIGRTESDPSAIALASGSPVALRLPARAAAEHVFIDVPAGTMRLDATTSSGSNVDLYLSRVDVPSASSATPVVSAAPGRSSATAVGTAVGGNESLSVANPAAGRWYVTPLNTDSATADVSVRATIIGTGPQLRAGGYFNPARSGSGLFIYPAGSQWAGIWYTYLQDGTPTWYYLQAQAPGATGIWRGTIFRSAWTGSSNFLTPVGEATVTPRSTNAFTFSYTLDGETGSEAFENFGGGCPTFSGALLNASGHWFDPARAGSGYSVQFFPNYEFYTVFGYDAQGVPRYLIAERNGIGAATETLTLAQNTGACPLCARTGNPVRSTVGSLTRTLGSGTLQRIQLNGTYTAGVPGTWAANDAVTPLGTLQGCAAN